MIDDRRSEDLVIRSVLERRAAATPADLFAVFPAERVRWTWADADRTANRAARALEGLGIGRGDVVATLAANGSLVFEALLGAAKLGAVISPLNPALRGALLQHALTIADAKVVVCDAQTVDTARALDLGLAVTSRGEPDGWDVRMGRASEIAPEDPGLGFWEPYGIIMTSGTTGPSKGVLSSSAHLFATVEDAMLPYVDARDVLLCDVPMFHVSGLIALESALQRGASLVVPPRMEADGYWERAREHGVTHAIFMPALAMQLAAGPPSSADRDHVVRTALSGPAWTGWEAFFERFGIECAYTFFNMTEISSPLVRHRGDGTNPDGVGRLRAGAEARIVDEHDQELGTGEVGELIVRTDLAWSMNSGYVNMPDATAAAWRNGWFHTGDLFRCDALGDYFYVDRLKDAVRRNGENISSFEIEREISRHPDVAEVAVVGAADERVGEEVLAFVVARAGRTIGPDQVFEFLGPLLPRFMLPRYVEILDALPRSAIGKVEKTQLRARGVGPGSWDRRTSS